MEAGVVEELRDTVVVRGVDRRPIIASPGLFAEMATGANLFLRDAGGARVAVSRDIPGFHETIRILSTTPTNTEQDS